MKMYRCMACPAEQGQPQEFLAEKPICPKCGLDGTQPRNAKHIAKLTVIHFDAPSQVPGQGVGHLACQPEIPVGQGHVVTGHAAVVNCPACQHTDAYRTADARLSLDPAHDVPVTITPTGIALATDPHNSEE